MKTPLAELACIYLAVWSVRKRFDADYHLSFTGQIVRVSVGAIGFALTAIPGSSFAAVRVVGGAIGLGFLCWPNFAYHLTNLFVKWPTAEARIISAVQSDNAVMVSYAFHIGDESFGGNARVRAENASSYSTGQIVTIAYDPLNPEESKFLRPVAVQQS